MLVTHPHHETNKICALTIGSQPTSRPPPGPSPFRMEMGRLAHLASTGYPFSVPKDERRVLSAYIIIQNGDADFGN